MEDMEETYDIESLRELMAEREAAYTGGWSVGCHHDWDSFLFWQPKNWRNFTLIGINCEFSGYKGDGWYEFNFALLGFHLNFTHTAKPGRKLAEAIEFKKEYEEIKKEGEPR